MKAAHPEVVATNRVNPGETLRQARESRSWSLPDVALRLNLTVTSLSNLENGNFEKLPGHTFARGYVRAYAKLLGLDQAALVDQFDQFTGTDGKGSAVHALGRIEEPVRLSHNILRIVSLLLLVILVGCGFFWWQDQATLRGRDQSGLNMEHVEVESADGTTQIHPLDEPEEAPVVEAPASGQTSLPLNTGAPASESPSAAPATDTTGRSAAQPQAPAAAPTPAQTAQAPVASPNVPSMPTTPAEQPAPVIAGAGQVTVQFVADCWTQVTDGNGKVLVSGLKRKGENLDVSGKPPLTLRLGYARGAQVTYNGQPVDVAPFTSGETARLKLGQ
ncbi:helix-turn-helix domain-containing protein [Pseudomonas coronafaciens]|uniref:RodZ domain-containing protein n=1 Tax=Pseudomonas coronafaciens TaxID=53409 RepID=UPI000F00D286|nr:RodZ family helix-turn-helix domain-containing protein [Pseudomonas coronafaciens]RMV69914.1 Cro/CI family transcriptional regulator [Pseudomonas coronafaciens pv. atropurpurea]